MAEAAAISPPMRSPKAVVPLREFAQVRALADPLRQKMLGAFAREPLTTKQVAACLGENPTKLYHHAGLLERAGLIRLVETRRKRGTTEKYYRAVAQQFAVERNLLAPVAAIAARGGPPTAPAAIFETAIRTASAELRQTLAAAATEPGGDRSEKVMLLQTRVRATAAQVAALRKKIQAWASNLRTARHAKAGEGAATSMRAVQLVVYAVPERSSKKARRKVSSARSARSKS